MKKGKVLIVDDNVDMLLIGERIFTKAGFEYLSARGGHEGLELMRSDGVDLVILDYMLPDLNGLQFLKSMAAEGENAGLRQTPVIILTARTDYLEELDAFFGTTLRAILTKPFGHRELVQVVENVLRVERAEAAAAASAAAAPGLETGLSAVAPDTGLNIPAAAGTAEIDTGLNIPAAAGTAEIDTGLNIPAAAGTAELEPGPAAAAAGAGTAAPQTAINTPAAAAGAHPAAQPAADVTWADDLRIAATTIVRLTAELRQELPARLSDQQRLDLDAVVTSSRRLVRLIDAHFPESEIFHAESLMA